MSPSILIVDDEKNIRLMAGTVLRKSGYAVAEANSAKAALAQLASAEFSLILLDYMMPGIDGLAFLASLAADVPAPPPVVFVTAHGSIETAVSALRAGAADYLAKPFTADELLHAVARNLRASRLEREVCDLRDRLGASQATRAASATAGIVAESPAMRALLDTAARVAPSNAPILIEGETGTGKERLARFVHDRSPRAKGPFIAVNCGALHPELLLSELFGHRRGAFTGAIEDRVGRFEAADGGTLFLDEIGELDPSAQVKLLRVLEEGTFERVGETRALSSNARVIAATNRRLDAMAAENSFRPDLYFRLAVVTLRVPPLRERPEDILPLADAFLAAAAAASPGSRAVPPWSDSARRALLAAPWVGNARELRNAVQRAWLLAPPGAATLDLADSPGLLSSAPPGAPSLLDQAVAERWPFDRLEKEYLRALLAQPGLTQADLAELLQLDPSTLWRKRKKHGL